MPTIGPVRMGGLAKRSPDSPDAIRPERILCVCHRDGEKTAWAQHAEGLAQAGAVGVQMLQDLAHQHVVEHAVREGQLFDVSAYARARVRCV
jgi:hypothetical protein